MASVLAGEEGDSLRAAKPLRIQAKLGGEGLVEHENLRFWEGLPGAGESEFRELFGERIHSAAHCRGRLNCHE